MEATQAFLIQYRWLRKFYLDVVFAVLTEAQMRNYPHPDVNSIAWIFWHIARVEDTGMTRFVVDQKQVFDEGHWAERLNFSYRYQGTGMTKDEAAELSAKIDLPALKAYYEAVSDNTIQIVSSLDPTTLDDVLTLDILQRVLIDEGVAGPNALWLPLVYEGWTKAQCLMHFGLTHGQQHVGEISAISALMGVRAFGG